MYPSQQLPNFINQLLILNDNVWDENRYWKITFSDPALLKQLLLNRLAPDDPSAEVKCYHLKNGSYYLVETERYSYRGDSLSITDKGIGIYSCLRNPDDTVPFCDRSRQTSKRAGKFGLCCLTSFCGSAILNNCRKDRGSLSPTGP